MGTQINVRASHQHHNPNLRVGSSLKPKPVLSRREASKLEIEQLNQAIACLKKAKTTDNEASMMLNVQEAFRLLRIIHRSRNDV